MNDRRDIAKPDALPSPSELQRLRQQVREATDTLDEICWILSDLSELMQEGVTRQELLGMTLLIEGRCERALEKLRAPEGTLPN